MVHRKKMKKKMGRPPAKWVYKLAELKANDAEYLDYHDLVELFGVTMRTVHGFCSKAGVVGEYYKHSTKAVRKRFSVKALKKAAREYIKYNSAHYEHSIS